MIQTVLGPIEADQLGPTSMHEQLFVDGETWYRPPETGVMDADAGLTLASAGPLRWRYFGVRDNLRIDDPVVLADELALARAAGASGVVDLTVIGLGRRVSLLPELATRTGLHVMVGCGFYVRATHPDWLAAAGADELTQQSQ